uniref:Uncharacterized protein n=1 Tax=Vespula pensylvanica TaxID=30213 RepID=A0A834KVU6_VESPE|nr:hypothetical protein H0235_012976 [Vespula pensylvanica]
MHNAVLQKNIKLEFFGKCFARDDDDDNGDNDDDDDGGEDDNFDDNDDDDDDNDDDDDDDDDEDDMTNEEEKKKEKKRSRKTKESTPTINVFMYLCMSIYYVALCISRGMYRELRDTGSKRESAFNEESRIIS